LRDECRLRLYANKALRIIFGPKRDEVREKWRRLHNKELYALYSSPNIARVVKSRRLRQAGHVTRIGEKGIQGFCGENLRERDHLEDPGVDWRIILKRTFKTWKGAWAGLIWFRIGTGGRLLWMR
jgi:hypothetical protein